MCLLVFAYLTQIFFVLFLGERCAGWTCKQTLNADILSDWRCFLRRVEIGGRARRCLCCVSLAFVLDIACEYSYQNGSVLCIAIAVLERTFMPDLALNTLTILAVSVIMQAASREWSSDSSLTVKLKC